MADTQQMKLWEFGGQGGTAPKGLDEEAPEMITVQQTQIKVE